MPLGLEFLNSLSHSPPLDPPLEFQIPSKPLKASHLASPITPLEKCNKWGCLKRHLPCSPSTSLIHVKQAQVNPHPSSHISQAHPHPPPHFQLGLILAFYLLELRSNPSPTLHL